MGIVLRHQNEDLTMRSISETTRSRTICDAVLLQRLEGVAALGLGIAAYALARPSLAGVCAAVPRA